MKLRLMKYNVLFKFQSFILFAFLNIMLLFKVLLILTFLILHFRKVLIDCKWPVVAHL